MPESAASQKARRDADPERHRAYYRKYHASHRDKEAADKRRAKYGLEPEEFDAMIERQQNRCAICKCDLDRGRGPRSLHVDHDHVTGAVRGALCAHCNRGIGLLGEDVAILRAALEYLGG